MAICIATLHRVTVVRDRCRNKKRMPTPPGADRSLTRFPIWIALVLGCTDRIVSPPDDGASRAIHMAVGQELRITLGNVGPAVYESPPQISSPALTFLDVAVIPPFTPAGPTQQFRFKAVSAGTPIVHFRRLLGDSVVRTVDDTILIR
jgi:hypothetical protein